VGGYPEWIRDVPAKDLPWNDDTPEYWCEGCWEFATDDSTKVKFDTDEKGEYWVCPDCGHKNYV